MLKPSTKQKPPPYPRPVEYVSADEVPLSLEETTYYDKLDKRNGLSRLDKHDAEVEAERRAAKRRRIEDYAAAYLRGESLYIMSAQLKGPFGKSWKNPWAKRKSDRSAVVDQSRTAEVPETAKTSHVTVGDVRDKRHVLPEVKKRDGAFDSAGQLDVSDQWSSNAVVPPTSPIMTSPYQSPDKTSISKPEEVRSIWIRDWLKTNEKYLKQPEPLPTASPTPTTTSRILDPPSVKSPYFAMQTSMTDRVADSNVAAVPINQNPMKSGQLSVSEQVAQVRPAVHSETHNENGRYPTPSEISYENRGQVQKTVDVFKAGSGMVNGKHVSLHVAPLNANFSPFEYKRTNVRKTLDLKRGLVEQAYTDDASIPLDENLKTAPAATTAMVENSVDLNGEEAVRVVDKHQGATSFARQSEARLDPDAQPVNNESHVAERHSERDQAAGRTEHEAVEAVHVEQDNAQPYTQRQSRPLPSTLTSDVNTADLLPSAQKPPELVPTLSSGLQERDLLSGKKHDQLGLPDDQESDFTPIELVSDHDITPNRTVTEKQATNFKANSSPHEAASRKDIPLVPSSPIVPRSTQEMLAGITAFTLSTIKKRTRDTLQETPVTATKKKQKTASFAPELHSSTSSHGSIQSTMRGKISKKLSSPPSLIVKDSMCMETDMDANSPENNRPSSIPIQPVKKPILKPTSSSPPFLRQSRISLFSECEQDHHQSAQAVNTSASASVNASAIPIGSGQNKNDKLMNNDDDGVYDLDAEISEIGSFLDPWQIDKEIEEMTA